MPGKTTTRSMPEITPIPRSRLEEEDKTSDQPGRSCINVLII